MSRIKKVAKSEDEIIALEQANIPLLNAPLKVTLHHIPMYVEECFFPRALYASGELVVAIRTPISWGLLLTDKQSVLKDLKNVKKEMKSLVFWVNSDAELEKISNLIKNIETKDKDISIEVKEDNDIIVVY